MAVGKLYVAGEVLCRRRAVWQWRAVRRWAVVGCLGGAWHFMVLAQMSQWPTAAMALRPNDTLIHNRCWNGNLLQVSCSFVSLQALA